MNSNTPYQLLLTPRETAKALSISERTLSTLTKDGTIPSIKLGGSRRYRVSDIEAMLDHLQSGSAGEPAVG